MPRPALLPVVVPAFSAALLIGGLGCSGAQSRPEGRGEREEAAEEAAAPQGEVGALAERAARGEEAAREELRELVARHPDGAVGDHAALGLGAVLLAEERWEEAQELLRRAAEGEVAPQEARLLLARAVAEGELEEEVATARSLLGPVLESPETPVMRRQALLAALQLARLAGDWAAAAGHGRELLSAELPAGERDEVLWLTAESLRLSGEQEAALVVYRDLWWEAPGSPRALEARQRLEAAGVATVPKGEALLPWVEQLQRYGLHEEALAALAPVIADGEGEARDRATRLAVQSHWVLRQNDRAVARAEELRRRSPRSPSAAEAALVAMRALGRQDRLREIRDWEEWLRAIHPSHESTYEGRYYLGSIVGSLEGEEAGLVIQRELAARPGPRRADAHWRIAWLERRRGDTAEARLALENLLAEEPRSGYRLAALYWLGRFTEDPERAHDLYRTVRREAPRDYYGRLAASRLEGLGERLRPLATSDELPAIDPLTDPRRRPEAGYRRAVELQRLGLPALAAAEVEALPVEEDPGLDLALAHLYARGGDTWTAIGRIESRHGERLAPFPLGAPEVPAAVWETYYPFPHRAAVAAAVARHAPSEEPWDAYLVASLARRESRFWARAASPAGAVGLMQLMPATAERVARGLGQPAPGRTGLFAPAVNMDLGTAYLAGLVAELDGEWAPALAAYNAGETRARQWWAARPADQELDEWIENIPYVETRLYVKKILGDYLSYRELYAPTAGPPASTPSLPG